MEFTEEVGARMVLATVAEPGDTLTGSIAAAVGPVEAVRLLGEPGATVPGVDATAVALWQRRVAPLLEDGLQFRLINETNRFGLHVLTPDREGWPAGLARLGDAAPLALWARGNPELLTATLSSRATVTGSRAATGYGTHVANEFAAALADDGRVIVTGGAYGIDAAALRAATMTRPGSAIVILASGVNRPYPTGNADLLRRVGDDGLVLSAYPPGAVPTRDRFAERARLLAAISGGTVIVEAGPRSGALRVAEHAKTLGRPLGAVPGPITSAASTGCHLLLRDGYATAITQPREITDLLDGPAAVRSLQARAQRAVGRSASTRTPQRAAL
ncbi:DNA-processing protein DprA [Microbacterium lacticum]